MRLIRSSSKELSKLVNRAERGKGRISEITRRIVQDVRDYGDDALLKYTRRFDKVRLSAKTLRVTENETNGAFGHIDPQFAHTLKEVVSYVTRFHRKELRKSWKLFDGDGARFREVYQPIERLGIYCPAGTSPLVSSVYMTVLPARLAGVRRIALCTPPNQYKSVDPYILAVANLLKVDEVYKVGGAQAIAAMAFGTKTIPRVDKIVGPGNAYVNEAKRQVFGFVDIDMIAGPSEVAIIANQHTPVDLVIKDLNAQLEHSGGLGILVTPSKALAREVSGKVERGLAILVANLNEAVEVTNKIAPEHLEILVKNSNKLLPKVRNAGCVFLGLYSPVTAGDYIAGPSHVLPTGGSARFFSGLGVEDFIRRMHVVSLSKKALERLWPHINTMAQIEGMSRHIESVKARLKE